MNFRVLIEVQEFLFSVLVGEFLLQIENSGLLINLTCALLAKVLGLAEGLEGNEFLLNRGKHMLSWRVPLQQNLVVTAHDYGVEGLVEKEFLPENFDVILGEVDVAELAELFFSPALGEVAVLSYEVFGRVHILVILVGVFVLAVQERLSESRVRKSVRSQFEEN